jgi:hypothetical protein
MPNKSTTRWLIQSVGGLLITGSGLSMAIDAGLRKMQSLDWFWPGTLALIIFQAGLCLLIDSVRYKK